MKAILVFCILNGGPAETVASYAFTHDHAGNPLTQTAGGQPAFADDRRMTVDRLDRLTATEYLLFSKTETGVLDRLGNREHFTPQSGPTMDYTLANAANEYATVDPDGPGGSAPLAVTYDAVGNLTVDEDRRHYSYDEQNRLTQVRAADGTTVLADYAYDALGRRVRSSILTAQASPPVVTRYYYDGPQMIEERDAADARTRYHVNGAKRIDERVATYSEGRAGFTYYLQNDLYSITGVGEADGTIAAAYIYDGAGRASLSSGGSGGECNPSDADCSGAVDIADVAPFVAVLLGGAPCSPCAGDTGGSSTPGSPPDGLVDGRDVQAFVDCLLTGDCSTTGGVSCTRGDINGDGFVDGGNIGLFMDVLLGLDQDPVHVCAADIDGDGDVDWTDEELFRGCLLLGSCDLVCLPGDVSGDGVVDLADVAPFVGVLLSETCPCRKPQSKSPRSGPGRRADLVKTRPGAARSLTSRILDKVFALP